MKPSRAAVVWMVGGMICVSAAVYWGANGRIAASLVCALALCGVLYQFGHQVVWPIFRIEHKIEALSEEAIGASVDAQLDMLLQNAERASKQEYSLQMLRKQAELNALQSQINPHFLYNTLDSIRGQALMEDMEELADMTEALSTFFRYNISKSGDRVTLEDELENVENYMRIQRFRFGDRIALAIEVESTQLLSCAMPKMTLQPLVENAVLHGLETSRKNGQITIRVQAVDDCMEIQVLDNGIGIPDEELCRINDCLNEPDGQISLENHMGIALTNVCQRIRLRYGQAYGVHAFSTIHTGTEVRIMLPLEPIGEQTEGVV